MLKNNKVIYKFRIALVFIIAIIASIILLSRLGYLFIVQKKFLASQGDARTIRVISQPAYRGIIFDRRGEALAVSTAVETIWANPSIIYSEDNFKKYDYSKINQILDLEKNNRIEKKLEQNKSKEFIYIKRHTAPDVASQVDNLNLPGIFIKREFRRFYPNGEVTSHIVGMTSIDEDGLEGVEYKYNNRLKGVPGKKQVLQDRLGRTVQTIKQLSISKPGEDIYLSIDLRLQYLTYTELAKAVFKHNASAGIAILLDIETGEILSLVNQPSFNPNDRDNLNFKDMRNRAVTDLFEPGSLLKPFSMVSVLENRNFDSDFEIDTSPGYYKLQNHVIKDVRNFGKLNLSNIIKKSSNVGISKLVLDNNPDKLVNLLYNLGFGYVSSVNFPGEISGWINNIKKGEDHKLATLSFGYGLATTPMQMLQSYYILARIAANKPILNIDILKNSNKYNYIKNDFIKSSNANHILDMLNTVMQADGTGRLARIANYELIGKTGTTKRLDETGYIDNSHNAMFIGMAPYPNPRLAMIVYIIDPKQNGYYGGQVAGPVFKKIMADALKMYGIPPAKTA